MLAKGNGEPCGRLLAWFLLLPLSCFLLLACSCSVAAASGPRNDIGDLVGLTARVDGQSWKATLTRDVMGREVDRQLPGGGRSYIWRDALGRPTQQFVGQGETAHRLRRLSWSFDERLMSLFEQGRGETKFSYDGRGYLSKVEHPDGRETLRLPDEPPERSARQLGHPASSRLGVVEVPVFGTWGAPSSSCCRRSTGFGHLERYKFVVFGLVAAEVPV